MEQIEDSIITNNKGVTFLNIWKTSNNVADLRCAIQHFEKAKVAARIEGLNLMKLQKITSH